MPVAFVITTRGSVTPNPLSTSTIPISDHPKVFNPIPKNDRILRIALACVGIKSPLIVRVGTGAVFSYVTEPRSFETDEPQAPISARHDAEVLFALEPRAYINVGSLAQALPSTAWTIDDGARIIVFPDDQVHVLQRRGAIEKPWRINNSKPIARPRGPFALPVAPMSIPGVFTIGHTRISKQLRVVDGVVLREGDVVLDVKGARWYFLSGRLQDRLVVSLSSQDYVIRGDMILPQPATLKHEGYVSDALYEVTLSDAPGQRGTSYPCRALPQESDRWGWLLEGRGSVMGDNYICMDPDGAIKEGQTQDTCTSSGGTWDHPCLTDNDCPYYDPRRARGGCTQSGFCEFPLGAAATSYRTADIKNVLLRGCSPDDPSYPWCTSQPSFNARFATTKRV